MNIYHAVRRTVALGLFGAALAFLPGCGGGGGGGSHNLSQAQIDAALAQGNFSGSFDTPTRAAAPKTSCTIQFAVATDNTVTGVASFVSGTVADGNFTTYSADIANVVGHGSTAPGGTGTFAFDMLNFTAAAPFSGTLHFNGTYVTNTNALTVSGSLTGKNASGTDVSIPFAINYNKTLPKIDLTGDYKDGKISVGTSNDTWTGSLSAGSDSLHLVAQIPVVLDPSTGQTTTLTFTGQNARTSFAGAFDAGQLNPLFQGLTGEWYVETHDEGKTLVGAYSILGPDGSVLATGTLSATKGTATGGSSQLQTGYYDGGIIKSGTTGPRVFKLDILHVSGTSGNNGAMVIVTGTSAPNIGGRIDSVVKNGSNVTITIKDITNTYSQMVLSGTVADDQLNVTYTATLAAGGTETGRFDALAKVDLTTKDLSGPWSGSITGASGQPNSFGATFAQTDDILTITPTTNVNGVAIPPIKAYVAGTSFAGHGAQTLTSPPATFSGDFDGDVDSNVLRISGTFAYTATVGTIPFSDSGTLTLAKG